MAWRVTGRRLSRSTLARQAHSQGEDAIAMRQKLITGPVVGPAQPKLPGVDPPPPPFTLVIQIHAWRCRGFEAPTLLRGPRSRNGPGPKSAGHRRRRRLDLESGPRPFRGRRPTPGSLPRQLQCPMKRCGQFWSTAGDEALLARIFHSRERTGGFCGGARFGFPNGVVHRL